MEHPTTTGSPLNRNPCLRATSTSSRSLPTDHSPTRMPRQPPPTSTPRLARDRETHTSRKHNIHKTRRDAQTPFQHSNHLRPPCHQQCHPNTIPAAPPPETGPQTDHMETPTNPHHPQPPLTHTTTRPPSRGHQGKLHHQTPHATTMTAPPPPPPTPPPSPHAAPPAAAPAEPYTLHSPAATRQHLRGLGDKEVLRLLTSGTTQCIRAATLVQATTLGEGVRDFLCDAILHVTRHEHPPLANPDSKSPPPKGDRVWVPPIDLGRHLVGHPEPGRVDTKGRTCYHGPNMVHPPPSTTPTDIMAWERRTLVDRVTSLSNFRDHVPSDIPTHDNQQHIPSTYMTLMYNRHYTVSTTHYHATTDTWLVHGTESLLPANYPPPAQPGQRHVNQGG